MAMKYQYQSVETSPQVQIQAGKGPNSSINAAVRRSMGLAPKTEKTQYGPRQAQATHQARSPMLPTDLSLGYSPAGMSIKSATRQSIGLAPLQAPRPTQQTELAAIVKAAIEPAVAKMNQQIEQIGRQLNQGPRKIKYQAWPAD